MAESQLSSPGTHTYRVEAGTQTRCSYTRSGHRNRAGRVDYGLALPAVVDEVEPQAENSILSNTIRGKITRRNLRMVTYLLFPDNGVSKYHPITDYSMYYYLQQGRRPRSPGLVQICLLP